MPRISSFYGIGIWMYWNEGVHERPHFHARYGEHQASVDLDGQIIVGPSRRTHKDSCGNGPQCTATSWPRTGDAPGQASRWSRSRRCPSIVRMDGLVDITAVEVLADQLLRLTFADGIVGDVAFDRDQWKGVLAPLADPEFFRRVSVNPESGTLTWPGELDLAPEPLYAEACTHRVAARN